MGDHLYNAVPPGGYSDDKEGKSMTTPYFLSFIEEFGSNPDYADYVFGRVEVWGDGPYADKELRFCTPRRAEFRKFRERWDFKDVTAKELALVERKFESRFNEHPKEKK